MFVSLALFSAQRRQLEFHASSFFCRTRQEIRAMPHNACSLLVMKRKAKPLDFEERFLDTGNRSYTTLLERTGRAAGLSLFYA